MNFIVQCLITVGMLCFAMTAVAQQNRAVAFGWGGQVETDIAINSFFDDNHTISIWFMAQYPGAYSGAFVANAASSNDKRFSFGQGRFNWSNAICKTRSDGSTVNGSQLLYVQLGNRNRKYRAPSLSNPGQWHHVAFVKTGNSYAVYLDANRLSEETGRTETIPAGYAPDGQLQLGDDNDPRRQYYGLLDNFDIYAGAASAADIRQLAARQRLGINAPTPLLQQNFNGNLPNNWNITQGSESVTTNWNNNRDARTMLPPNHKSTYYVPFPAGEIWRVLQGQDNYRGGSGGTCGSHIGWWSFSMDFRRMGPGFERQSKSKGEAIVSSSFGTTDVVVNSGNNDTPGNPSNFIKVLSAPGEWVSYLHFAKQSNIITVNDPLQPGDYIADVSDIGSPGAHHLHSSLTSAQLKADAVSMPMAYSDYEYSTDEGKTWQYARRRMPQQGDWIRSLSRTRSTKGKLTSLRVNDVGLKYGNGNDSVRAEVVIKLEGEFSRRAYGFTLQKNTDEISHRGMLTLLRAAFIQQRNVKLTFRKTHEKSYKHHLINVELE